MHIRKIIAAMLIASLLLPTLTACASSADEISAQYVSPIVYQDYSCRQIRQEITRVSQRVQEISGVQDAESTKDAWAMGVGLVLFWPALFFLIGDDKKNELGRLKGEYEALEKAAINQDCSYVAEMQAARKERQEASARAKAEEQEKRETINN